MRPKLIHVTTVDRSLDRLLRYQLLRFREHGFDVLGASAPGPHVAALEAAGIPHVAVPALTRSWSPEDDLRATAQLVRAFRRERPSVVHTHGGKTGVLGRAAARVARVPVIVNTVHGPFADPSLPRGRRWAIDRGDAWSMRLSDHELFPSEEDLRRAICERIVPPARASWLGEGVDLRRFDPATVTPEDVAATRAAWGVPEGIVVVGSVTRLARDEGLAELVGAAEAVRRERSDVAFVIVGPSEPTQRDGLSVAELDRARAAGVILPGEGAWEDLPAIHAAFDVFVLASHREGVPRSLIEASAMGRPVIATDVRGRREVVDPGVTGTLVPVRDARAIAAAVRAALEAPNRAAVGEAGRRRALDRFDEDAVVERTLQVYRRLLRRHGIRWDGEQPAG